MAAASLSKIWAKICLNSNCSLVIDIGLTSTGAPLHLPKARLLELLFEKGVQLYLFRKTVPVQIFTVTCGAASNVNQSK